MLSPRQPIQVRFLHYLVGLSAGSVDDRHLGRVLECLQSSMSVAADDALRAGERARAVA